MMNTPRAFTLMELLLALVLSAVLMMGVLAVVTNLGSPGLSASSTNAAADGAGTTVPPEIDAWVELLRGDLAHASHVSARPDRIALTGYGALDTASCERTHRAVAVLYALEDIDGRRWLVRRQAALDVLTNRNRQRDLVCTGIERFSLVREGQTNLPTGERGSADSGNVPAVGPRPAAAAEESAAPSVAPDQVDEVRINGQSYYVCYLPDWARPKGGGRIDASGTPGDAEAGGVHEGAGESGPKRRENRAALWRLRVWTDGLSAPAVERIVSVRGGGGA